MNSTVIHNKLMRSKSKLVKKLKVSVIKSENVVLMEVLTKKCHISHHKKEIQGDDFEIKDPNLHPMYEGNHTPPRLVYNIYPETPESCLVYKEPSDSPFW